MQFMNLSIARRVEMAEAEAGRACAEAACRLNPGLGVAVERIAGGIAVFAGVSSPISQAVGVGLDGPADEGDLDKLEEFFFSRGAAVEVELCPLVDMSWYQAFGKRNYRLSEVSNVLVLKLGPKGSHSDGLPDVAVRPAAPDEADLWTRTVAQGFAEHFPVTQPILDVMQGFFHRGGASCFLAFVGREVAGGGAVAAHGGVGGLFGASTLPKFRRRGVQAALLAARLAWACERECDIAVSIAQPGSASQRNIERSGFQVAYTRTKLVLEKD